MGAITKHDILINGSDGQFLALDFGESGVIVTGDLPVLEARKIFFGERYGTKKGWQDKGAEGS